MIDKNKMYPKNESLKYDIAMSTLVVYAVQTPPPLIRRFAPPSPKIREKAKSLCYPLVCTANDIHYNNSVSQRGIFLYK